MEMQADLVRAVSSNDAWRDSRGAVALSSTALPGLLVRKSRLRRGVTELTPAESTSQISDWAVGGWGGWRQMGFT